MVVYPRWRGELRQCASCYCFPYGLSPLTRGTPPVCQLLLFPIRFIPADAGNSSVISSIAELNAVYPRWRGELYKLVGEDIDMTGLSPLARGTLPRINYLRQQCRFIPAGAGNSATKRRFFPACTVYPRWRGELEGQPFALHVDHGLSPLARGTH